MKLAHTEVKFYPARSEISNRFEFTSGLMIRVMLNGAPYSLLGTLSGFLPALLYRMPRKLKIAEQILRS